MGETPQRYSTPTCLPAEGLEFAPSFAPDLVKGVATYSLEPFRAAPPLDALYVPIGLGSGICGAIAVRDLLGLRTEIIGVQASGAPAYARSFAEGRIVALNRAETLADGVAVRDPDPEAFAIIRAGAARIVTLSDDAIADAIRAYWTDTHNLVEGAGAAPPHGRKAGGAGDQRRQYRPRVVPELGTAMTTRCLIIPLAI